MHGQESFLQAIAKDPDDDGPRLIYADWLEEFAGSGPNGDTQRAHAEFIRVQCELARMEERDPRRKGLERREKQLLQAHRKQWGPLPKNQMRELRFHRGFLEKFRGYTSVFLREFDSIFRTYPLIRRLSLEFSGRYMRSLICVPELQKVIALRLENGMDGVSDAHVDLLGYSRFFRNLKELHLAGSIRPFLFGSEQREGLLGDAAAHFLAHPHVNSWQNLREITLQRTHITPQGVRALAQSRYLPMLRVLRLKWHTLGQNDMEEIRSVTRNMLEVVLEDQ